MGMEDNQSLPDFVPLHERHLVDGQPALRIDWQLPWNCQENRDMVSMILGDLTIDPLCAYSQLVASTGFNTVVGHCMDSVHNLYYRRRREQRGDRGELQVKARRSQRRRQKRQKREEELKHPSNTDLASQYVLMKWTTLAATSEDETDGEPEVVGVGEQEFTLPPKGKLILPAWRSLQLEEIIRETDHRRQTRLQTLARPLCHPGEALLPAFGNSPPPLPPSLYRWMVSRRFAEKFPAAVRLVRTNLVTRETPDPLAWGDPPPFMVREANSGDQIESPSVESPSAESSSVESAHATGQVEVLLGDEDASGADLDGWRQYMDARPGSARPRG